MQKTTRDKSSDFDKKLQANVASTTVFKYKSKKITRQNKNTSKKIHNGSLVISNDKFFEGTDGKSQKTRMSTVVDSNRKDELAIVKLTTSKKNGRRFKNDKGFDRHGQNIYTRDNEGNPIKIDNKKFLSGSKRRSISLGQANEIKRRNIRETKLGQANRNKLRELKDRKKRDR